MKVTLGKEYKDTISGFQGVATARTKYLYGCIRVLLVPTKLKPDGDFLPDGWFDEAQLVKVRATKAINKKTSKKPLHGPHSAPTKRSVPPRR